MLRLSDWAQAYAVRAAQSWAEACSVPAQHISTETPAAPVSSVSGWSVGMQTLRVTSTKPTLHVATSPFHEFAYSQAWQAKHGAGLIEAAGPAGPTETEQ